MSTPAPLIVWFRRDLRLRDNSALAAALETGRPLVAGFFFSPEEEGEAAPGAAARVWLHHSLKRLRADLDEVGIPLVVRAGASEAGLRELMKETGATAVFWNRCYAPTLQKRDAAIKRTLRDEGREARSFNSGLLVEPWELRNGSGQPFQVYTPFWKAFSREKMASPVTVDFRKRSAPSPSLKVGRIEELDLLPGLPWAAKMMESWTVGEDAARRRLERFLGDALADYGKERDFPGQAATSRLSPYLAWGQIGPRQIWKAVKDHRHSDSQGAQVYLKELAWREFAHLVLYHFPETVRQPLRSKYAGFPWRSSASESRRWQRGLTGYPLVDAGMRELWETGWMHNRVRMVVGSFLVKHLLHSWQEGADWFWDTLVDADVANNTLGWQWVGGCGADAAPYFRIFNPFIQGAKFDGDGTYVKRFVPELAKLPEEHIQRPWEAPAEVLERAGVRLGEDYPLPMVDHQEGRERALAALNSIKDD